MIKRGKITLADTQVINGIQQVCLSCPIESICQIKLISKLKPGLGIIFEIGEVDMLDG